MPRCCHGTQVYSNAVLRKELKSHESRLKPEQDLTSDDGRRRALSKLGAFLWDGCLHLVFIYPHNTGEQRSH